MHLSNSDSALSTSPFVSVLEKLCCLDLGADRDLIDVAYTLNGQLLFTLNCDRAANVMTLVSMTRALLVTVRT